MLNQKLTLALTCPKTLLKRSPMNKFKSFFLIALISFFLIEAPKASDGKYITYGAGNSSCGTWLSERPSGNYFNESQWMLGFISATGYYEVMDLKETDAKALTAWMDNYCRANPLDGFNEGVHSLVEELAQ